MIAVVQLGTVDYAAGLQLQRSLVELRHTERIPNVLLLLEHRPVITLGRNANRGNVVASPELLERQGVQVFPCDRGGDVTFHGPGQLVGYPIFNLRSLRNPSRQTSPDSPDSPPETSPCKTLGAVDYVRCLEEALVRTCADFGVAAGRIAKLTGVWTEGSSKPQAKLAAIGVHISRGITSHGFALNVNTDLEYFKLIVPCGIASKPVTSLAREAGMEIPVSAVADSVARNFGRVFASQILWVETLDALLGNVVGVPARAPEELRKLHEDETFWA
jgi:lipoyl(octanoyl) transferase